MYEGRTRGKRMKYTFSDEEEELSDILGTRRSTRNSGRETPNAPAGPTVTASGRHVRARATGMYGESLVSGQTTERASPATGEYVRSDASEEPQPTHGRSTRAAAKGANGWPKGRKHIETYNSVDEMDDEDDATSSGGEWDGGDEDEDAEQMDLNDDDDHSRDESSDDEVVPKSLVVRFKYTKGALPPSPNPAPDKEEHVAPPSAEKNSAVPIGSPLSVAPQDPTSAPAPAQPALHAAPPAPSQPVVHAAPNGLQTQPIHAQNVVQPVVHEMQPTWTRKPEAPNPEPQGHFSAPTPPYVPAHDPVSKSQFPVSSAELPPYPPFATKPLPNPTPTSTASFQ